MSRKKRKKTGLYQTDPINENDMEKLCLKFVKAESEKEVIDILKAYGYWGNPNNWTYYGDNENNYSIIGNQQSAPEAAIVEKLVNSVDAVLTRECLRKDIDPESKDAPQSIAEAQRVFFSIRDGSLWQITAPKRTELADNIAFVATGKKRSPCYSIIDKGEGQTPNKMPDTLLSLSKSNKLRIPFVQGKFNMGGTGAFQFSGKNNLQLIISKRDPLISQSSQDDFTKDFWGFTLVRREEPKNGRKSSCFKYLVIDGRIPMFKADSLPLMPGKYPNPYENSLEWGTYIKLYEYQMRGLLSPILLDLNYRINILLPDVALPIRFYERRRGYRAHSYETTMSGLSVRLAEDRSENLENNFPSTSSISVSGERMECQIFAFKKGQSRRYRRDEGIIFTINGQTHGHIPASSFFIRKAVNMSYLADSILVVIDCTNISIKNREDLFMNSRDRLRNGDLKKQIEDSLQDLLGNHPGLKELRNRRRLEEIRNKLEDEKPLKDVLADILKKSPSLSSLLIPGIKLHDPFNLQYVRAKKEKYVGKDHPTYFKCTLTGIKNSPINRRFRVIYETDVKNNYFKRSEMPGDFKLYLKGELVKNRIMNLWNGVGNLTVTLPESKKIGNVLEYKSIVTDQLQTEPFEDILKIRITPEIKSRGSGGGNGTEPPSTEIGDERQISAGLSLPHVIEVYEDEWEDYDFTKYSALKIQQAGEEGYDFFVNMDNIYALTEIKTKHKDDAQLLKKKYQYALVLVGLALLHEYGESNNTSDEEPNILLQITKITSKLSAVILPMISYLGDLEIQEL